MFYEIFDYDTNTDNKDITLINLDKVTQICGNRMAKYGSGKTYHCIEIYYDAPNDNFTFYYLTERERNTAYNDLKSALKENRLLMEKPTKATVEEVKVGSSSDDPFGFRSDPLGFGGFGTL